ncbi:MAG: hypothetical protein FWF84_02285, partial [Kiritimatiellaeota bacterium]|nr:hypothetical protein [Kiritimatiellota bacterium]
TKVGSNAMTAGQAKAAVKTPAKSLFLNKIIIGLTALLAVFAPMKVAAQSVDDLAAAAAARAAAAAADKTAAAGREAAAAGREAAAAGREAAAAGREAAAAAESAKLQKQMDERAAEAQKLLDQLRSQGLLPPDTVQSTNAPPKKIKQLDLFGNPHPLQWSKALILRIFPALKGLPE